MNEDMDRPVQWLVDQHSEMFARLLAFAKMDRSKVEVARWCYYFQRYRAYELLGYRTLQDYLCAQLGVTPLSPRYHKARNAWYNLRKFWIRQSRRGQGGVTARRSA